jgi:hypothetical protein
MMKAIITSTFLIGYLFLLTCERVMAKPSYATVPAESEESSVEKPELGLGNVEKGLKNTVRFNITNPVFLGIKTLVFGYERTIGEHQSISIDAGPLSLPKLSLINLNLNDSFVKVEKGTTEKGYHVSVDYRFYLSTENKFNSPRGIYLAPYYSHNFFERTNTWTLSSSQFHGDVSTDFKLTMNCIGGELGYQFVLWNRMAIDLILIGPGVTRYSISTSINTTLDADDKEALLQRINEALANKIPGYSLVIDKTQYETSGNINTTNFGFRYMINIGFRF